MTVEDLGWGGATLTGKMSGTCSSDHTAPVITRGNLGYRACYTLGIKTWTWVLITQGPNYRVDHFLPCKCGTLPQAALFPMTLAPPPPRGCDGTHNNTSNLGRPQPVKMLPRYSCHGNRFHQNHPSPVHSRPPLLSARTGRLGPVPTDSTSSQLLATARGLSLKRGHGQDSSATWQLVLIREPAASGNEAP